MSNFLSYGVLLQSLSIGVVYADDFRGENSVESNFEKYEIALLFASCAAPVALLGMFFYCFKKPCFRQSDVNEEDGHLMTNNHTYHSVS